MVRTNVPRVAFNAGEISPLLDARVDTDQYLRGCRTLLNGIPIPQGPINKRLGSWFVVPNKNSARRSRLIPFIFGEADAFQIELSHLCMRFFRNQSIVLDDTAVVNGDFPTDISGWTSFSLGTGTITHDAVNFRMDLNSNGPPNAGRAYQAFSDIGSGLYTLTADVFFFPITVFVGTAVGLSDIGIGTLAVGTGSTFSFTPTTNGQVFLQFAFTGIGTASIDNIVLSNPPYEIISPYTEDQIFDVKYDQRGDIVYFASDFHHPYKLSRFALTLWTLALVNNIAGPVLDRPANQTVNLSSPGGAKPPGTVFVVTASAPTFDVLHVGSLWAIEDENGLNRGYARMTGFTSSTVATFTAQSTVPAINAPGNVTLFWYEAAWSAKRGYPRAVAFHESRLCLGGTRSDPLTVDGSKTNDRFENFERLPGNDDDAFRYSIGGSVNTIQWLLSDSNFLVAGTIGGLANLGSGTSNSPLTPTNVVARVGTSKGASSVQGLLFEDSVKYVNPNRTKLFRAAYDDTVVKYQSQNISLLNDVILKPKVVEMAVQDDPFSLLWSPMLNGEVAGFVEESDQQVLAWCRINTGAGDMVESVSVIPGTVADEVWMVVRRNINGNLVRYIEYFEPDRDVDLYVDSAIVYDGTQNTTLALSALSGTGVTFTAGSGVFAPSDVGRRIFSGTDGRATIVGFTSATEVTCDIQVDFLSLSIPSGGWALTTGTITGLDHLEGRTVAINNMGAVGGTAVVIGGQVTMPNNQQGSLIYVGLPYAMDLEPTFPEMAQTETGPSVQGKRVRVHKLVLRLYRTLGLKVGPSFDKLRELPFRLGLDAMDRPPPLFGFPRSQFMDTEIDAEWANGNISIRHDYPTACTIASLDLKIEANDH